MLYLPDVTTTTDFQRAGEQYVTWPRTSCPARPREGLWPNRGATLCRSRGPSSTPDITRQGRAALHHCLKPWGAAATVHVDNVGLQDGPEGWTPSCSLMVVPVHVVLHRVVLPLLPPTAQA